MKYLILVLVVFLLACSDEPVSVQENVIVNDSIVLEDTIDLADVDSTIKERLTKNENEEFLSFYKKITDAIVQSDLDLVNKCIDPDGLYIIETSGAMPFVQKIFDVKAYSKKSIRTTFFNLGFIDIKKQPVFDALPKVICAGEVYDKYGCFAEKENSLKDSGIWNYSDLNEKEIQAIKYAANNIVLTVRNTQNFTFYFSKTIKGYKLTFLDVRIPCEA